MTLNWRGGYGHYSVDLLAQAMTRKATVEQTKTPRCTSRTSSIVIALRFPREYATNIKTADVGYPQTCGGNAADPEEANGGKSQQIGRKKQARAVGLVAYGGRVVVIARGGSRVRSARRARH